MLEFSVGDFSSTHHCRPVSAWPADPPWRRRWDPAPLAQRPRDPVPGSRERGLVSRLTGSVNPRRGRAGFTRKSFEPTSREAPPRRPAAPASQVRAPGSRLLRSTTLTNPRPLAGPRYTPSSSRPGPATGPPYPLFLKITWGKDF